MGTIRRKREIYHIHPLPRSLRYHASHNPEGHTHLVHRVREKRAPGGTTTRERRKRQVEPPPVEEVARVCPEDGKILPPVSDNKTLLENMLVDLADTLILDEFQGHTAASRQFGENYVHAAIFLDHTMVEKHDGDEVFLLRYHLAMFNIVRPLLVQSGV